MRHCGFIGIVLLFCSCGTTGHVTFYEFDKNKYQVEKEILSLLKSDSSYAVPTKWKDCNKGDYFERIYVYFKSNPEELYRVGFTNDSAGWNHSTTCTLGLISQFDGEIWKNKSDLTNRNIERIEKRFELEILSKINTKYSKAD